MRKAEYRMREDLRITTSDITLGRADTGCTVSNYGATGTVNVTLPPDAEPGDIFTGQVDAAQYLNVKGGANTVFVLGATAGTAGHAVRSNAIGDRTQFICLAANVWRVQGGGSWAAN